MSESEINIFFAPVSSGDLYSNFEKTVLHGIPKNYFEAKRQNQLIKSNTIVRLWGIRDAKKTTYNRTKIGDYVFFYKEGFIIGYSKVYSLFVDEELSRKIWGVFENKQRGEKYSWSNIIVFDDFYNCNIPFMNFIKLADYSESFSVRGYLEFREVAVQKIKNEYGGIEKYVRLHQYE